jgi:hypothetical protein
MTCKSFSLNSILGLAMIVGLMIIHISSDHYTTVIFSTVYSSFWHISHFRRNSLLHWCTSRTRQFSEYTLRWTWPLGGEISRISYFSEQLLCQSFFDPTRLTWSIFCVFSMHVDFISWLVIFEIISPAHQTSASGFSSGWSHVHENVATILRRHGILWLEQCCPHTRILT